MPWKYNPFTGKLDFYATAIATLPAHAPRHEEGGTDVVTVTGSMIPDATLVTRMIAPSAVTTAKINTSAVTTGKIAASAVTAPKINTSAVITRAIASLNVTTGKIAASAVTTAKLNTSAVTTAKIASLAVTTTKIAASAVTTPKINTSAVTTAKIASLNVTTGKLAASAVTTPKLNTSAVTTRTIASLNVTTTKLAASAVTTAKLNTSAVTTAKIASLAVTTGKIAASAVTAPKINTSAVITRAIASLNVTTGKIAASAVTTPKINTSAVTSRTVASLNITTAKIANSGVTTAKLDTSAVTTAKIASRNVTTTKLAQSAVTTAKLNTSAVTSAKIAASAVTNVKIDTSAINNRTIASLGVDSSKVMMHYIGVVATKNFSSVKDKVFGVGRLTGGTLVANPGSSTATVRAGTGIIRTADSHFTPSYRFDWAVNSAVPLTNSAINYVGITYNAGAPIVKSTTDRTAYNFHTNFTLGRINRYGTTQSIVNSGTNLWDIPERTHERFLDVDGFRRGTGGVVSEPANLKLATTAGTFYLGLNDIDTVAKNTNTGDTFRYWYRGAVAGTWTTVAAQTSIDNTQYDDGDGTLGTLTANRYGVHWVYIMFNGSLEVQYGQGDYTLAQAEAVAVPTAPDYLTKFGVLAAKVIVQKSAAALYSITSAYTTAFPSNVSASHNALGGLQGGDATHRYHLMGSLVTTTFITNSAVTAAKLNTSAVTTAKIAASAVTAPKINTSAVITRTIASLNVTTGKIAASAVTAPKINTSAVITRTIASRNVTTTKLAQSAVTRAKIKSSAVIASMIATGAVTNAKINSGAVTTAKISAAAVTVTKVAASAITFSKIAASNAAQGRFLGRNTGSTSGIKWMDAATKTGAVQSIYVDKAAVGGGTGVDWANAFTTIQGAIDSLATVIEHAVTIYVRKGATDYAEYLSYSQDMGKGGVTLRGEYYWVGTCAEAVPAANNKFRVTEADGSNIAVNDEVVIQHGHTAFLRTTVQAVSLVAGTTYEITTAAAAAWGNIAATDFYRIVKTRITLPGTDSANLTVTSGSLVIMGLCITNGTHAKNCVLTIAETSLSIYTCIIESTVAWAMVVYGNLYGYSTYFEGNAVAIFGNYTYIVLGSTAVEGCVCKGTGSSYGALYMAYNSFIAFFWSVVDNQAAASYGIELIGLCYGYIYASGFTTGTPTGLYCAMGSTALEYSCTNNATIPRSPAAASDPSYISVV